MVCIDNSEWMRNGDFRPTRLDSQRDAINLVCGSKIQANPENTVGLLTLAKREVLVTLTDDMGKLLTNAHKVRIGGESDLVGGLLTAQLALKHRPSKMHRQRIIAFVGSPVSFAPDVLTKLGKKLKKSNVSVDVISFGEDEANREKLEAFINAVNKDDTSHLVSIPSGSGPLSDSLVHSPILQGEGGGASGGANINEFGVDPSADPELALALRVSMEEERARQERAAQEAAGSGEQAETAAEGQAAAPAVDEPADAGLDAELQAAMALSLQGMGGPEAEEAPTQSMDTAPDEGGFSGYAGMSEEEQMRLAIEMSMNETSAEAPMDTEAYKPEAAAVAGEEAGAAGGEGEAMGAVLADPNFLSSVLGTLPGVDPEDEQIKSVLASLAPKEDEGKDDGPDKK